MAVMNMARTTLATAETGASTSNAGYTHYVNPQWVRLLGLLEMNVRYKRCVGAELPARRKQARRRK